MYKQEYYNHGLERLGGLYAAKRQRERAAKRDKLIFWLLWLSIVGVCFAAAEAVKSGWLRF